VGGHGRVRKKASKQASQSPLRGVKDPRLNQHPIVAALSVAKLPQTKFLSGRRLCNFPYLHQTNPDFCGQVAGSIIVPLLHLRVNSSNSAAVPTCQFPT
jgi:hypothetical protein